MPPRPRRAGGPTCWNAPEVPAPTTWAEAVALARRKLAMIPAFNADLFLHFLMLVKALGVEPVRRYRTNRPAPCHAHGIKFAARTYRTDAARDF